MLVLCFFVMFTQLTVLRAYRVLSVSIWYFLRNNLNVRIKVDPFLYITRNCRINCGNLPSKYELYHFLTFITPSLLSYVHNIHSSHNKKENVNIVELCLI